MLKKDTDVIPGFQFTNFEQLFLYGSMLERFELTGSGNISDGKRTGVAGYRRQPLHHHLL